MVTIHNHDLQWPNDIALHPDKSALLFGNVGKPLSYIGSHNLDININHRVMAIGHLFGLETCNDTMYWTDWSSNQVYAAFLNGKGVRSIAALRGNGIKSICWRNQAVVGKVICYCTNY